MTNTTKPNKVAKEIKNDVIKPSIDKAVDTAKDVKDATKEKVESTINTNDIKSSSEADTTSVDKLNDARTNYLKSLGIVADSKPNDSKTSNESTYELQYTGKPIPVQLAVVDKLFILAVAALSVFTVIASNEEKQL